MKFIYGYKHDNDVIFLLESRVCMWINITKYHYKIQKEVRNMVLCVKT
jgi:hypothetical protein